MFCNELQREMRRSYSTDLCRLQMEYLRKDSSFFTLARIDIVVKGINLDAPELDAELNKRERSRVIQAAAILYLETPNAQYSVLGGQQQPQKTRILFHCACR